MPDPRRRERADACPGAWRRHQAVDGALARFRPVGGAVSGAELRLLADAAGDAPLELTSRGSLQVRGLGEDDADALASALSRVEAPDALLDAQGRDVPCSVVASPSGALDDAARAVADALRGREDVPGRLLVALDDGSGDVADLDADVTLIAGRLRLAGTDTDRHGDPTALALAALEAFLAVRGPAWRVAEVGAATVLAAVTGSYPSHTDGYEPVTAGAGAGARLEVTPRLGELDAATVDVLAGLDATLRVTPWRTVVLRDLADPDHAEAALDGLDGLVVFGPSPWRALSACVGAPRCAKSHTDVRGDLARAVAAGTAGRRREHWVGCERACGTPAGAVTVVEGTPSGAYRRVVRTGRVSG